MLLDVVFVYQNIWYIVIEVILIVACWSFVDEHLRATIIIKCVCFMIKPMLIAVTVTKNYQFGKRIVFVSICNMFGICICDRMLFMSHCCSSKSKYEWRSKLEIYVSLANCDCCNSWFIHDFGNENISCYFQNSSPKLMEGVFYTNR